MAKTRDPETEVVRKNLKKFRTDADLTTDAAAQAAGIALDNLRRYEGGGSGIPASVLHQLATIYGHKMEDFFLEDPPKPDLVHRPAFFLRTLPGVEIDAELHAKLQAEIDRANELRAKKLKK